MRVNRYHGFWSGSSLTNFFFHGVSPTPFLQVLTRPNATFAMRQAVAPQQVRHRQQVAHQLQRMHQHLLRLPVEANLGTARLALLKIRPTKPNVISAVHQAEEEILEQDREVQKEFQHLHSHQHQHQHLHSKPRLELRCLPAPHMGPG
jgi:hypothetical protein